MGKNCESDRRCGNIDGLSGKKRGENVVRMVSHEDKKSEIIGFYAGDKESEKTVVTAYFEQKQALNGSYSFDALHTAPDLLTSIDSKGGSYLVQVKKNQPILLEDCQQIDLHLSPLEEHTCFDKGHGREEQRKARLYCVDVNGLDKRWSPTNIQSLLVIDRINRKSKNGKISTETAYFLSNKSLGKLVGLELFQAGRGHWNVESDNWIRDATLGEDEIKCKESGRIRMIASAINNALNIFRKFDIGNNIRAFRENLIFDRTQAMACLAPN